MVQHVYDTVGRGETLEWSHICDQSSTGKVFLCSATAFKIYLDVFDKVLQIGKLYEFFQNVWKSENKATFPIINFKSNNNW